MHLPYFEPGPLEATWEGADGHRSRWWEGSFRGDLMGAC